MSVYSAHQCTIQQLFQHLFSNFSLKFGLMVLFTHLKIIMLQCFQFSIVSKWTLNDLAKNTINLDHELITIRNGKFEQKSRIYLTLTPVCKKGKLLFISSFSLTIFTPNVSHLYFLCPLPLFLSLPLYESSSSFVIVHVDNFWSHRALLS